MVTFPTFRSISALSINLNSQTSTVYANGRNQIAVTVKLSLLDEDTQYVHVDQSALEQAVYLCDYITGNKLPNNHRVGFFYSKDKNDYCTSTETEPGTDDRFTVVQLYISADGTHDSKDISCGINIEGIGDIDTSEYGTANKLPNGSTYIHQDKVTVTSVEPIDYSDKRHITIVEGDFVNISSNLGWTSRLTTEGPYKEHYDGSCKRRIIYISPNVATTRLQRFKNHEITYEGVQNEDVNDQNIVWKYGINQTSENCFEIIQTSGCGMPCAVIGRGINRGDYQLNLWYSRQNKIHVNGQLYVVDGSYFYRFCPFVAEDHTDADEKGMATLLLYKFTIPENNTYQWHWHDVIRLVTVNVTDIFGNKGSFQLTFDDENNFDKPGLV